MFSFPFERHFCPRFAPVVTLLLYVFSLSSLFLSLSHSLFNISKSHSPLLPVPPLLISCSLSLPIYLSPLPPSLSPALSLSLYPSLSLSPSLSLPLSLPLYLSPPPSLFPYHVTHLTITSIVYLSVTSRSRLITATT